MIIWCCLINIWLFWLDVLLCFVWFCLIIDELVSCWLCFTVYCLVCCLLFVVCVFVPYVVGFGVGLVWCGYSVVYVGLFGLFGDFGTCLLFLIVFSLLVVWFCVLIMLGLVFLFICFVICLGCCLLLVMFVLGVLCYCCLV